MSLFRFIFGFLYTRNWHTGEPELSRMRVAIFASGLFLLVLALFLIALLQVPVTYQAPPRS